MKDAGGLRTIDLGREAGLSAQQVRNYESYGFLPPCPRSPAGYRRYSETHLDALVTARTLIQGYGWQRALQVMQAVHGGRIDEALALADSYHGELDSRRRRAEDVLDALGKLRGTSLVGAGRSNQAPGGSSGQSPSGSLVRAGGSLVRAGLRVGEAAAKVGVAASSVRYWEQLGLLHPERDPQNRYRVYRGQQFVRLQVVALLRAEGCRFDVIRLALEGFGVSGLTGRVAFDRAIEAVQVHRARITAESRLCTESTAALWAYLVKYGNPEEEAR